MPNLNAWSKKCCWLRTKDRNWTRKRTLFVRNSLPEWMLSCFHANLFFLTFKSINMPFVISNYFFWQWWHEVVETSCCSSFINFLAETKIMQANFISYFTMSTSLSETAVTFCSPFLANFITYKFKKGLKTLHTWLFSHTLKFQCFQIPLLATTCPHTWQKHVLPTNQNSKFWQSNVKVYAPTWEHFDATLQTLKWKQSQQCLQAFCLLWKSE